MLRNPLACSTIAVPLPASLIALSYPTMPSTRCEVFSRLLRGLNPTVRPPCYITMHRITNIITNCVISPLLGSACTRHTEILDDLWHLSACMTQLDIATCAPHRGQTATCASTNPPHNSFLAWFPDSAPAFSIWFPAFSPHFITFYCFLRNFPVRLSS